MSEFIKFLQSITFREWISFFADILGIGATFIAIFQICQVKGKVTASITAIKKLETLQEHELLKKILQNICVQQDDITWLLEKQGQPGYRDSTFEEKKHQIISAINGYLNQLPSKYKEIIDSLRSVEKELYQHNYAEAEGYLYSAVQAIKDAEEKSNIQRIDMIAQK